MCMYHKYISYRYCKSKFDLWFIPPYSCEFNSIETYWAVAKRAFKKANLVHRFTIKTREEFLNSVRNSLQISTKIHHNLCNANRDYLHKILTS